MGGHSDICAGAVAASAEHIDRIFHLAKNLGGSLSDYTVWLLERSLKTMGLRVRAQNENAMALATFLKNLPGIGAVYYPGLKDHPDHDLACRQMKGFGGMLSFELGPDISLERFVGALQLVKASMSLAGVESTLVIPSKTSHGLLSPEERMQAGISESLIRFSAGIEDIQDLKDDIVQALEHAKVKSGVLDS